MARILQGDISEGANYVVGPDGRKVTRVFEVEVTEGDAFSKKYNAELCPGIPRRGEAHPSIPFLFVDTIDVADSEGNFRVSVNYKSLTSGERNPDEIQPVQIEIGTYSYQEDVSTGWPINVSGNNVVDRVQMFSWLPATILQPDFVGPVEPIQQFCRPFSDSRSLLFLRLSRKEAEAPRNKALNYQDCINSVPFLGGEKHTWLCKGIVGTSADGGLSYNVVYEFLYNKNKWYKMVVTRDPATDNPIKDASREDNVPTIIDYRTAEEKDFAALNLGIT